VHLRSSAESAQPASLSAFAIGAVIGAGCVLTRRRQTKTQRGIFGSLDEVLDKSSFNPPKAEDLFEYYPADNWRNGVWVDNEGGYECDAGWVDTEGGYGYLAGEKIPGEKEEKTRVATLVYAQTLIACAKKLKEIVVATKDIRKIKEQTSEEYFHVSFDEATKEAVLDCLGGPIEKAEVLLKQFKLESTVVPAMIRYMATKDQLGDLQKTAEQFLQLLYEDQRIASVIVKTATPFTDAQVSTLTSKLKMNLNVNDVKLKTVIDERLISGFVLEYAFLDEDKMENPMQTLDQSYLAKLAAVTY